MQARVEDAMHVGAKFQTHKASAQYHGLGSVRNGPLPTGKGAAGGAPCVADDVLQEAVAVEAADTLAGRPAHHRAHISRQRQVAPHGVHKLGQLHAQGSC